MKHLVFGYGEVGKAVYEVLHDDRKNPNVRIEDLNEVYYEDMKGSTTPKDFKADVLHVCIPYILMFDALIEKVRKEYLVENGLVIIHSTVAIGTSKRLNAVHSPIRGVHPNIANGIRTFVKFFGGERADEAAMHFTVLNIHTVSVANSADTEAGKILDTTQLGWFVILNKMIYHWCKKHNVDFNVAYRMFNETYNDGYIKLNRPEVVRPHLNYTDGQIGGHCVMPNLRFIEDSPISTIIEMVNQIEGKHTWK